jgi:hypothetical protein
MAGVEGDVRALEDTGFAVIRGFLSADDIAALAASYATSAYLDNANYKLKQVGLDVLRRLLPKLDRVAAGVRAQTSVDVDLFNGATYFANEETKLAWHQEFEPYYLCQNLFDYLNFYVPFYKEDPTRSNLCVVPFDALRARDASAYARLVRGGARTFTPDGGRTVVTDSTTGERFTLGVDVEQLAVAPALDAGDLLLVRGDVVHRTQDQATKRVAISLRMTRGAGEVTRARLAEGGLHKLRVMLKSRRTFECAFEHFAEAGERSTVERLAKHLRAKLPTYRPNRRALARMLASVAPRFRVRSLWSGA